MNKRVRLRLPAVCLAGIMLLSAVGCGGTTDFSKATDDREIVYEFPKDDIYMNGQKIEGQWGQGKYTGDGEYGIGDPFVLRYNGKYYMYPSSDWGEGENQGIRVYSSEDIVNWKYEGYAVTGAEADSAYAPEVVYYNGWFFLCESQAGRGHYIYKSKSPTGPFERVTNNFGRNIDGSFWIADDGALCFLYPTGNTIQISSVNMQTMTPGVESTLTGTLNGWTEGPGFFRRGDYLYMTYAGNNVISDAYRVGYSYQHGSDPTGAFIMPENNLLLLCTDPKGFRGLGHNSNVIGPDLDSWYATYHCLVAQTGPQRRYMVDRLLTDGALVTANGPSAIGSYVPKRPSFEARSSADFQQSGNLLLSSTETEAVFTAEYNFIPAANSVSRFIFGYTDEKNYTYASWDAATKSLVLAEVSGGNEKEYGRATVDFASDEVLHTVRVEQGAARLLVYFDSMRKLDVEHSGAVGQIGVSGSSEWQYTAFSNDAFGTSDFETVKSVPGLFPATSYLKGENRGFSLRKATVKADGIRQGEREKTYVDTDSDTHALVLDARGDWVKYAIRVTEDSYHGVSARISTASAGARFQLIVDNEKVYTFTVPASGLDNGFAQLMLGQIPLTKGNHTLKLRLLQGKMEMTAIRIEPTNPSALSYENALNEINEKGWSYVGNWKIQNEAHTARPGDTAYAYAGDDRMTDFTLEVEVAMTEEASIYDAGILLRAKNHVLNAGVDESFCGYYLSIRNDQITLSRYQYGAQILDLMGVSWQKDEYHKIRIVAENNRITVYVDDMDAPAMDIYDDDAFLSGQVGLCTNKAGCSFRNFKLVAESQR